MKLPGGMGVVEIQTAPAAEKHVSAQPGNGQAGENAQPWVELLGHDVTRGIESDGAQSKHPAVCEAVTMRPSSNACRAVPREPTR
jgi:hypothetical protein